MSSVSTDVLIRLDSSLYVHTITGYYIPDEDTHHVIVGVLGDGNFPTILSDVHWKAGQGVKHDPLAPMPAAGGPAGGYYVPGEGTQHIVGITRGAQLIEGYWKSGQAVKFDALTDLEFYASFCAGYYVPEEGTQHVIFSADNSWAGSVATLGIITEVYWKSGQGVNKDELARFNGAVYLVGAYYIPEEGTQHAIVSTPDGNLTELYWKSGQGVKQDVLVPHENRKGVAFYSAHDSTQHAILLSADGTLTDVYWQSGQGVHQNVLTQLPGITHSDITGITGYYSANDQKRHVIVATADRVLTEVYW